MKSLSIALLISLFVTPPPPPTEKGSDASASVPGRGRPAGLSKLDFKSVFGEFDGCFVLKSIDEGWTLRYNESRCAEPLAPCSTFKIFNSLAGLESGFLTGADHKMKWDGTKQWNKSWEKDHTLATAIRDSVLWYYQNVAEGVGAERMQKYLDACGYGNRDISGGIRVFWLMNSFKVSADEQIAFLEKLYTGRLPFGAKAVEVVKSIIVQKSSGDWVFSGKTGSGTCKQGDSTEDELCLGWFVGHVKHGEKQFVFALNIKGKGAWGPKAREMAERFLSTIGLIEQ